MKNPTLIILFLFINLCPLLSFSNGLDYDMHLNDNWHKADSLNKNNRLSESLSYYKIAIDEFEKENNRIGYNNAVADLIRVYTDLGMLQDGKKLSDDFLSEPKNSIVKDVSLGRAMVHAAMIYRLILDIERSKELLTEAIPMLKDLKAYRTLGDAYIVKGNIEMALNSDLIEKNYLIAKDYFTKACGEDCPLVAVALNRLALDARHFGHLNKATEYINESLRILENSDDLKSKADAIFYLGIINSQGRDFDNALERMENAKQYYAERFGKGNIRISYVDNLIGNVYTYLEKFDVAESYFKKAYANRIEVFGKDHLETLAMLMNTANQQSNQGNYKIALENYEKVLQGFNKNNYKSYDYFKIHRNIGNLYLRTNDTITAKKYYLLAAKYGPEVLSPTAMDWIDLRLNQAETADNIDEAIGFCEKALETFNPLIKKFTDIKPEIFDSIVNPYQCMKLLSEMTHYIFEKYTLTRDIEVLSEAYTLCKIGLKLADYLRITQDSQGSLEEVYILARSHFYLCIDMAWAMNSQNPNDANNLAWTLNLLEKTKAWRLLEILEGNNKMNELELSDSIFLERQNLRLEIASTYNKLIDINELNYDLKTKLRNEIFVLKNQMSDLDEEIRNNNPSFQSTNDYLNEISLEEIRFLIKKDDDLLIHYAWSNDHLYSLTISNDNIAFDKIETENLKKNIINLHKWIKEKDNNLNLFNDLRHSISNALLTPIDSMLKKANSIVIIPDGILHYLSFDILNSDSSSNYLIEEKNLSYAYSGLTLQKLDNIKTVKNDDFLAVAPTFKGTGELAFSHESNIPQDVVRNDLSPLPGATNEVKNINKYFNGKTLTEEKATEASFKASAQNRSILHLATHAIINDENPSRSYLVLSTKDSTSQYDDGYLYQWELENMNFRSELTVLSACNTGYGKLKDGEGLMSLGRAFMQAGSQSVLMSSWPAQDYSTSNIMNNFYKNISQGLNKNMALRLAKLDFIKNADANLNHPFYWAGFSLYGQTQPLSISSKDRPYIFITLILGIMLLITLSYYLKRKKSDSDNFFD